MANVVVKDSQLRQAAASGPENFMQCILQGIKEAAGGTLDSGALQLLSTEQLTLWAYDILREELMEGGFVQLIHNGWGDFFFSNPFALVMKRWGLRDLSRIVYGAAKLYREYGKQIMHDCTDDEFMALYEQFPDFDEYDDEFVDREEEFSNAVATYIDENLSIFCTIAEG